MSLIVRRQIGNNFFREFAIRGPSLDTDSPGRGGRPSGLNGRAVDGANREKENAQYLAVRVRKPLHVGSRTA